MVSRGGRQLTWGQQCRCCPAGTMAARGAVGAEPAGTGAPRTSQSALRGPSQWLSQAAGREHSLPTPRPGAAPFPAAGDQPRGLEVTTRVWSPGARQKCRPAGDWRGQFVGRGKHSVPYGSDQLQIDSPTAAARSRRARPVLGGATRRAGIVGWARLAQRAAGKALDSDEAARTPTGTLFLSQV